MELISLEAGSGQIKLKVPGEWIRRSLLEGGEKLAALIEAVKEVERFDFKYIVYPKLLEQREKDRKSVARFAAFNASIPTTVSCTHIPATISKKMHEKGIVPYCLKCGETLQID